MSNSLLRVAFDTTVFFWSRDIRKRLREKIKSGEIVAVLPVIAYSERLRQIADSQQADFVLSIFKQFVADLGFSVAPFTERHAESVADLWLSLNPTHRNKEFWRANKADIFIIAMSEAEGWTLVTDDEGIQFTAFHQKMNCQDFVTTYLG
jgi:hypothetical protein